MPNVKPMCALASEVLLNVEDQMDTANGEDFACLILAMIDQYAKSFIPPEHHVEFFNDMSDNVQTLRKVANEEFQKEAN